MRRPALRVLLTTLVLMALVTASESEAIVIGFDPLSQTAAVGSSVDVDLSISGLGDGSAPSLGVFDIDVKFDPAVLAFNAAVYGDQLGFDFGSLQITNPDTDTVNLFELSLDSAATLNALQAPHFVLATLTYDVLGAGVSDLSADVLALGDAEGLPLSADTVDGSITASVVPEPATGILTGLGWLALLGCALRNRNRV